MRVVERLVPAYGWLRGYGRKDLPRDLSAGLVVTVMLVPQAMAYALLAGLPPIYGLYASTVPAVVYAFFGTSRHMPVGPPALMALLTFTGVSALAEPRTGEYISLALLLALMAGTLQLAIGLFRMGFITNFIPNPVLSGFIYASAIVIALGQLKHLLGISISAGGSTVGTVLQVAGKADQTQPLTLAIGALAILALVLLPRVAPRFPASIVVVAAGALGVYLLGLDGRGVEVVGEVPRGLPDLSVPALDPELMGALLPTALTVAFVGFVESISMAKAVAAREKYKVDSNQELKALGLANMSAAFFSGFPVAGSFSRTAVNYQAGARTQLSVIVSALMVVLSLLLLTPLFYYLPNAALSAVIVVAVWRLLDLREAVHVFRVRRADGYALGLTFLLTLFVGVEEGIILGAAFALLAFIRRTAYPDITELGYVEGEQGFFSLEAYPAARTYPDVLILRFDARLYYANVPFLEEWLIKAVAERPSLKWIVIDCRGVNSIDATAVEGLKDLVAGYRSRGIKMLFTHVKLGVRKRLRRAAWEEGRGEKLLYPTTRDAMRAIGFLQDRNHNGHPGDERT